MYLPGEGESPPAGRQKGNKVSIPANDRREKYDDHSDGYVGAPGEILAASLHTGNPGVGLFIPYQLAMYLGSWNVAAVYAFIAQASMANSPWGGIGDDRPPGEEVCLTHGEIGLGTGLKDATVARAVKQLAEANLLTITRKQSERHGWSPANHYVCHFGIEAQILDAWVGNIQ